MMEVGGMTQSMARYRARVVKAQVKKETGSNKTGDGDRTQNTESLNGSITKIRAFPKE